MPKSLAKNTEQPRQFWLMKSEPEVYSIEAFKEDKSTLWTGVRNFQARGFMIGELQQTGQKAPKKSPAYPPMKINDLFLFYHSNANPSACVGIGRITRLNQVDPTQYKKDSDAFEPKASREKPVWFCCECSFVEQFKSPVSLEMIRQEALLAKMLLLARGSRLSIQPVKQHEFETICRMGQSRTVRSLLAH